jgi:hypothetical protein
MLDELMSMEYCSNAFDITTRNCCSGAILSTIRPTLTHLGPNRTFADSGRPANNRLSPVQHYSLQAIINW